MGCGESKHDVATGNTISRNKSNVGEQSKKGKDAKTVLEKGTNGNETDSLLAQQEEGDQNVKNNEVNGDQPAAEDVKDIAENTERKKGDNNNNNNNEKQDQQEPTERFISKESPNRYFSSRKEEETVEGIVSEGRSEKSEYDSPRPEAGKESLFNIDNERVDNAVEGKKLAEETIPETQNAEGVSMKKEENLAKETDQKPATAIIAEVSAPTPVENNVDNAEKEQSVASPTKEDLKTVSV